MRENDRLIHKVGSEVYNIMNGPQEKINRSVMKKIKALVAKMLKAENEVDVVELARILAESSEFMFE